MTKRSGPNLTDAQRATLGWGRITLRLPIATLELLETYAHEADVSRAEIVDALVLGGAPDADRVKAAKTRKAR